MGAVTAICHVRWQIRRDMPEVLAIERESFPEPWTEDDFLRCLRQRNAIGMVAEHSEKVVGYIVYQLFRHRLKLLKLAVHPDYRRLGVGSQLIRKLVSKLSPRRRTRIAIDICERSLPAQKFLSSQGFKAVRVLRGECPCGADAYRFVYRLRPEPEKVILRPDW